MVLAIYNITYISCDTHNAEQSVKIWTLFVRVPQGTVDFMRRGGTFTALTALTLQLGVAAQSHSLEVV